jgi:glycosyltransferase involved in cell wall biosynthesis
VKVIFNLLDASVGGGQRVAAGVAEALHARGHTVAVVVPAEGPALRWFADAGATVHHVDLTSLRRPTALRKAAAVFATYDLVYSHTSVPGAILGGAASARARTPHVIHQHIYPHFSAQRPMRAVQRSLYARAASGAHMIAVAEHVADAAVAAGVPRGRITVIPNGVEIPPDPGAPSDARSITVGQLARLDIQKGLDILLDAVGLMKTDASFAIGTPLPDDAFGRAVHDNADRLGVRVVAPASREFLETVDIVAAPSRYEGHPLVLMEAMALGKPVVASEIPGVREMLETEQAGLLVPNEDPAALAKALDSLVADPELRARLGARARDLMIQRYALPVVHTQIIEVLERCVRPASA